MLTVSDISAIVDNMIKNGPCWKPNKLAIHLEKRKKQGHIPENWTAQDYNDWIMKIVTHEEVEIYNYWLPSFKQDYVVFGLPRWVVIVGTDGIMETAFEVDRQNYYDYLRPRGGFVRIK